MKDRTANGLRYYYVFLYRYKPPGPRSLIGGVVVPTSARSVNTALATARRLWPERTGEKLGVLAARNDVGRREVARLMANRNRANRIFAELMESIADGKVYVSGDPP